MSARGDVRNRNAKAALVLRLAGASYPEIAETVGYSNQVQARNAVIRALATTETSQESINELRAVDSARIDRLLRGLWAKATSPTDPEHLQAAKMALSLIDRHIRLYGLDAPQEVIVYNPTVAEIDAWLETVAGMPGGIDVIEGEVIDA